MGKAITYVCDVTIYHISAPARWLYSCHVPLYNQHWSLIHHQRGIKQYIMGTRMPPSNHLQCGLCDKKYSRKDTLVKHIRTHTQEKPFQCAECDARFREKSNLVRHMRTHTNEKPFKCAVCDTRFKEKASLVRHLSTRCRRVPTSHLQCVLCDKKYSRKDTLASHLRSHITHVYTLATQQV